MSNSNLNQALAELETSLGQLDSARSQVSSVSEKSEKAIESLTNVLRQLEKIEKELSDEKNGFSQKLDATINRLNLQLKDVQAGVSGKSSLIQQEFQQLSSQLTSSLESAKSEL